ncbi:MAG: aminotransferase class I/II-fold pyridoxal phosphate-dependent enzyme [Elusimicrobia bacterium]|nr:aminotransferase class I/II-fold pyridoxal phosphate-dependent enzyme [Elusimicrobiota bacterium]
MKPIPSKKLSQLPPYLFVRLHQLRLQAEGSGLSIIDLGQGSPDLPSPDHVVKALQEAVGQNWTHRYPQTQGLPELRRAIAAWYRRRFDVTLDADRQVLPLVGSKEGLAHLFMALLEPGQSVLVPNPCYPVHYNGVILAGGRPVLMPLLEENEFKPDLRKIPAAAARQAKVMLLNYPNNPTGAVLEDNSLLEEALAFSRKYGCLIAYDNAYSELVFDGYQAPSILQVPGAMEHAVEFHSLSKSYSMAGWRIGFVVGNAEAISQLAKFKGFLDYGIPNFIQQAGINALSGPQDTIAAACRTYRSRRDALVEALSKIGWTIAPPRAAMYLWGRLPERARSLGSLAFAERLILEHGVVIAPGVGFGPHGEGFMRFSLVAPEEKLREAARRIGRFLESLPERSPSRRKPAKVG